MKSPLTAVLLLLLGACSLPQQRSRAFEPYAPLEAYITSTSSGGPLFHVNRPAYVAMFYIVPGSGVSMLYPGFGSGSLDGRVFAGSHFASRRITNREQYFFAGGNASAQPRFYFLIASDRPLDVQQFGTFGGSLQSRLGGSFHSFSAYSTMEDLAQLALPSLADDGSWTTDMYVDWPSVISREPARGRVLVRCNGYEMFVPVAYLQAVQSMVCDTRDGAEQEDLEADSAAVVKPKSREPLPADAAVQGRSAAEARAPAPADREALRERISSSSQLGRPISRRGGADAPNDMGRAGARPRAEPRENSRPAADGGSRGAVTSATSRGTENSRAGARPTTSPSSGGSASAPSPRPSSGDSGQGSSAPAPRPRNSSGGD